MGLRDYLDPKTNTIKKKHAFFEKKWRAPSIADLFQNIDKYIAEIPQAERYNLYLTEAVCFEEPGRKLKEQWTIPIDIDDVDLTRIDETLEAVLFVLKVPKSKVGIVYSGNGIQLHLGIKTAITDAGYFDKYRSHYKAICDKIDLELAARKLPGHADTAVFSAARLMRLPHTRNVKPGKPERQASLINAAIEKLDFTLEVASSLPQISKEDFVSQIVLDRFPTPDTPTILAECEFLKRCKLEPKTLPEPQWYAMLSILGKLANGQKLAHEYSKGHPTYSPGETDLKLTQSLENSGPRTCKNINSMWGKCSTCKHFGTTLVSPIMIRGPEYIKTLTTGFHETKHDANGNIKPGKPNYEDLRKFFQQKRDYFSVAESGLVYGFTGTHWEIVVEGEINSFAQIHFMPTANNLMRREFYGIVSSTNTKPSRWFEDSAMKKINFKNGYLDLVSKEFHPHSKEVGFRYVLPYDYDPQAQAPRFEKFLREVTLDRQETIDVLLEFSGYAFSNDNCWTQKALMLLGEGANGKSTFLDVLKKLAGKSNYSSLMLSDFKDSANRLSIDGKLFNVAEETARYSLADTSLFKNLVTGGETTVKMLYHQPFAIKNRAKLIFAANEMPKTKDTTSALFRRFIIVPFRARFEGEGRDPQILEKLYEELPGIFNLVIAGYWRLLKQGHFSYSEIIEEEVLEYRDENDLVKNFISEKVEVLSDYNGQFVSCQKLFDGFINFAESCQEDGLTRNEFFSRLKHVLPDYKERFTRKRLNGEEASRGLKGIVLSETTEY